LLLIVVILFKVPNYDLKSFAAGRTETTFLGHNLFVYLYYKMSHKTIITLLFYPSLFFVCCKPSPPPLTDEQKGEIVLEVKETLNNYYADIKSGGLTSEFNYLDNSKDFYWTPPGYTTPISFDSVSAILKMNAPNYKEIDNSFESLNIEATAIDSAFYSGKIKSITTDTSGTPTTLYLNEKGKLIKRKDGWKLLSGETTLWLNR